MGRHTGDVPIEPIAGQAPYGVDGPPARLRAGYLRRQEPDRVVEGLDPPPRTVKDLNRWEKAVAWAVILPTAVFFLYLLPSWGVPYGWAHWVGWLIANVPVYLAADWYVRHHEPWAGPRWLHRKRQP